MAVHELKTWSEYFGPIRRREKTFDSRWNDRDYQVGDRLLFREFDPVTHRYTGEVEEREISYILAEERFGVRPGYAMLGLRELPRLIDAGDAPIGVLEVITFHADEAQGSRLRGANWSTAAAGEVASGGASAERYSGLADACAKRACFHEQAAALVTKLSAHIEPGLFEAWSEEAASA